MQNKMIGLPDWLVGTEEQQAAQFQAQEQDRRAIDDFVYSRVEFSILSEYDEAVGALRDARHNLERKKQELANASSHIEAPRGVPTSKVEFQVNVHNHAYLKSEVEVLQEILATSEARYQKARAALWEAAQQARSALHDESIQRHVARQAEAATRKAEALQIARNVELEESKAVAQLGALRDALDRWQPRI